ncbi:hypothetical protein PspLS_01310, partial [Pyricularia sp. CBS 133598]
VGWESGDSVVIIAWLWVGRDAYRQSPPEISNYYIPGAISPRFRLPKRQRRGTLGHSLS